jgi:hypothetical protein
VDSVIVGIIDSVEVDESLLGVLAAPDSRDEAGIEHLSRPRRCVAEPLEMGESDVPSVNFIMKKNRNRHSIRR